MGWQSEGYYMAALERIQEAYFMHKNGYLELYNAAAEVIRIGVNRWHRLNKQ